MLLHTVKKSTLQAVVVGCCSLIITMISLTANVRAEIRTATASKAAVKVTETGTCLYSRQLAADPALKAAFTTKISAEVNGDVEESDELIYFTDINAGGAANRNAADPDKTIDRLSNDCLSCHDGVMAQNFNVRIKNKPGGRVMSLEDIIGGHPVGMEYDRYVSADTKGYKSRVAYYNEMIFSEGKVGCLTCHNPLNRDKGHLAMNNDRSELCFSCHNK